MIGGDDDDDDGTDYQIMNTVGMWTIQEPLVIHTNFLSLSLFLFFPIAWLRYNNSNENE